MGPYTTDGSKKAFERAKLSLAGGVCKGAVGVAAGYGPYPIFVDRGLGSRIYDVDGNEYIDYVCGFGPLILGHRPPKVIEAVKRVLDSSGSILNMPSPLEYEVAERIAQHIPSVDLVRFGCSGGEVVRDAVRAARVYTGREKVVRFEGHFHGLSGIHFSHQPRLEIAGPEDEPRPVASTGGIPKALSDTLIIQPWNNPEVLERTISRHRDNIAAVVTEPVMANCGVIPPREGYLQFLRDITRRYGIVLIFDEIKTGFRLAFGGAAEYYGVMPDLAVYAKALGGGFPLAAIGGTRELMNVFVEDKVWQSGTYTGNLQAVAAAKATLEELEQPGFYQRLNQVSNGLVQGLQEIMDDALVAARVQSVGSLFQIFFTDRPDRPINNYREAVHWAKPARFDIFFQVMRQRGIYFHPQQLGGNPFVSAAHTEQDVQETLERINDAMPVFKEAIARAGVV